MYNDCNICESSDKELESYVKTLPYETSFHRVSPPGSEVRIRAAGNLLPSVFQRTLPDYGGQTQRRLRSRCRHHCLP